MDTKRNCKGSARGKTGRLRGRPPKKLKIRNEMLKEREVYDDLRQSYSMNVIALEKERNVEQRITELVMNCKEISKEMKMSGLNVIKDYQL